MQTQMTKEKMVDIPNLMRIFCVLFGLVIISTDVVVGQTSSGNLDQQHPCDHPNAVKLPKAKKCLVPYNSATSWANASATCEAAGGLLYETPDARLGSRPDLMNCLASMSDARYDDMWINAVGLRSAHFFWINGTWVNKVDYCTLVPPSQDDSGVSISSDYLSVDYCVSSCHDVGARYIVLHNKNKSPECYCRKELPQNFQQKCLKDFVDFTDSRKPYYIVHSKEDSLIKLSPSDIFSRTESLCVTVDTNTLKDRQMKSDTCFTRRQFICCLGGREMCVDTNCLSTECRFYMNDKCMLRVSLFYTWHEARAYCVNLGGDLWNMHELNEMGQVNQNLDGINRYWIGATNYGWSFNATSSQIAGVPSHDDSRVRCGHMFRERSTSFGNSWQWSDANCDQAKAFLCQFNTTNFKPEELQKEVVCPWVVNVVTSTTSSPTTTARYSTASYNSTTNATSLPTFDNSTLDNGTIIIPPLPFIRTYGESFPIAAVIAAIIAGIILLTALCVAFAWCSRSPFMSGRFRRVRERLAFIPYFANIPVADYEGHSGMRSVSEHGSQVGLMKGEFQTATSGFAMSSSQMEQSGMFTSKSVDMRQGHSMDRRFAEGQNYLASGSSSMDERGFAAADGIMNSTSREYMTLQAQMNIRDDAEVAALRESFRRKPEVTLVTDNVDLNFTVNHAVSQGQSVAGSETTRLSSEQIPVVEGIIMPTSDGGFTVSLDDHINNGARGGYSVNLEDQVSSGARGGYNVILEDQVNNGGRGGYSYSLEDQVSSGGRGEYSVILGEQAHNGAGRGAYSVSLADRVNDDARIYSTLTSSYNV